MKPQKTKRNYRKPKKIYTRKCGCQSGGKISFKKAKQSLRNLGGRFVHRVKNLRKRLTSSGTTPQTQVSPVISTPTPAPPTRKQYIPRKGNVPPPPPSAKPLRPPPTTPSQPPTRPPPPPPTRRPPPESLTESQRVQNAFKSGLLGPSSDV